MAVNTKKGDYDSSQVSADQEVLKELGYYTGEVDGDFGSQTDDAVRAFQREAGLVEDGIIGPKTRAAMEAATSGQSSTSEGPSTVSSNVSTGTSGNVYNYYTGNTTTRDPFVTSSTTDDWGYKLADYTDNSYGDYVESDSVTSMRKKLEDAIDSKPASYAESEAVKEARAALEEAEAAEPGSYQESEAVKKARAKLAEIESNEPADFNSRYDSTINQLLDTIKNRKSFDVNTDTNYQTLYNNYKQNYQVQADKAMRDTMGAAAGATGGYGSTYSQLVGQQAYDTTMQGLNDQNINLMSLAYSMYGDDRANDYNKLSAYQSQDNIDYSRYRDSVNDWKDDRSYYANRADTAYNQDYGQYRDTVSDWQADRSYAESKFENERAFDYGKWQDNMSQWNTDRAFAENQYENERAFDYNQYETGLDQWNADRAFTADQYNNSYANDLSQYEFDTSYDQSAKESIYDKAMAFASQGIQVPSSYYNQLSDSEIEAINDVAQQYVAEQKPAATKSSGSSANSNGTSKKTWGSTDDDAEAGIRQAGADKAAGSDKITNKSDIEYMKSNPPTASELSQLEAQGVNVSDYIQYMTTEERLKYYASKGTKHS